MLWGSGTGGERSRRLVARDGVVLIATQAGTVRHLPPAMWQAIARRTTPTPAQHQHHASGSSTASTRTSS